MKKNLQRPGHKKVSPWTAFRRGARGLCPRCGQGKLFKSWDLLESKCSECGLVYEENPGDTWGFMYVSTGFITGLFIIGMFLIRPAQRWLGIAVVAGLSLAVMLGTQGLRKGIAVAMDFLLRQGKKE